MEQDNTQHLHKDIKEATLRKCPQCDTIFSAIAFCPNDGNKLEEHHGSGISQSLFAEKYEILEEVGKGGMGTVYRVKQVLLDKILALKIIPSHCVNEQLAVRFQREAKTMSSLNHPNLGRVCDFGIWLNQPFMVMEFVSGSPLSKMISERVIPPEQAVELFSQVLNGLAHAHEKGVLHRDIKPSNIMVLQEDGSNKAILLDFGIAKRIETDDGLASTQALTRTGEMIGSPLYMSPEQARGDKLTERSDLYSLGCSLFESLTGTPPFVGKTAVETLFLHMEHNPPSLKEAALGRDFAPGLEKLLRKLLAKNPEDRFSSAAEVRQALSECLQHDQPEKPAQTPKKNTRPVLPIVLMAAGSAAVLLMVALFIHQGENASLSNAKKLKVTDDSLLHKLPKEIPTDPINDEEPIAARIEAGKIGAAVKDSDPIQAYVNRSLDNEVMNTLIRNKNLVKLTLSHCNFPIPALAQLPPSLRQLELNGGGLLNDDYKFVANNANLEILGLRYNAVTSKTLHYLAVLKKLESLNLNSTHVDGTVLKELKPMSNLRRLNLSENETIDDSAIPVVASLNQLEWLDISNTKVSAQGIRELAKMPRLKELLVKNIMLADNDVYVFKDFKTLETLSLAGNPLTAEGVKLLPVLPRLTQLDLSECHLKNDACPYLLRFKNLQVIHLSKTRIKRAGFLQLAKLPLTEIFVKRVGLSYEDGLEFLRRCPTCQFVYYAHSDVKRIERAELTKKHREHEH